MSSPIGQLLSKALEILKKLEEQVAEKTPGKYLMNLQPVHKHYPWFPPTYNYMWSFSPFANINIGKLFLS